MKIWVDADACPLVIKEIIFRASERLGVSVTLVANQDLRIPRSTLITKIQVPSGYNVADNFIVQNCTPEDIVVTADIPLAALIVEKEALAINPRGEKYTASNIGERLAMRNLMQNLRDTQLIQGGGPTQFNAQDKQRFASTLDKELTARLKKS